MSYVGEKADVDATQVLIYIKVAVEKLIPDQSVSGSFNLIDEKKAVLRTVPVSHTCNDIKSSGPQSVTVRFSLINEQNSHQSNSN